MQRPRLIGHYIQARSAHLNTVQSAVVALVKCTHPSPVLHSYCRHLLDLVDNLMQLHSGTASQDAHLPLSSCASSGICTESPVAAVEQNGTEGVNARPQKRQRRSDTHTEARAALAAAFCAFAEPHLPALEAVLGETAAGVEHDAETEAAMAFVGQGSARTVEARARAVLVAALKLSDEEAFWGKSRQALGQAASDEGGGQRGRGRSLFSVS